MSALSVLRSRAAWLAGSTRALQRLLVAALVMAPLMAMAARSLPDSAQYGKLTHFDYPYATIGGKTLHMAPGARIYNQQNMIIMPVSMVQSAEVLYRLDTAGQLSAIWILTDEEARARKPAKPAAPPGASNPAGTAR